MFARTHETVADQGGTVVTQDGVKESSGSVSAAQSVDRRSIWESIPQFVSIPALGGALVLVWDLAVRAGFVSDFILPPPARVIAELGSVLVNVGSAGTLLAPFWLTLQAIILGFLLASCLGIGLGILVGESSFGRRVALPFLVGGNAAPKVAFAPLFVAWFGFGIASKVAMAAFIAFFPLMIDTAAGLASVGRDELRLFRSIRASWWQTFFKLKLPTALPSIIAGLKTAVVLSVVGTIVAEFLSGGRGIGGMIQAAGVQLQIDRVFAYIVLLSLVGYGLFSLIAVLERKLVYWRDPELFR